MHDGIHSEHPGHSTYHSVVSPQLLYFTLERSLGNMILHIDKSAQAD